MAIFAKPIFLLDTSYKNLICGFLSKEYNIKISLLSKGNAIDACISNRNSAPLF